jgi:hypothetical protein
MYDKILVAVDQSPVAERVLVAARELAQLTKGEVRVVQPAGTGSPGRASWRAGF